MYALSELDVPVISFPDRYFLIAAKGDELLDWREMVDRYRGSPSHILEGSDHGLSDFESRYFDAVYYSHLIRLRKPERDIYEYVLADADILPGETLFIDDLEENIAGAAELGIRGIVKTPDRDIIDILSAF